jgi:glycine/D-amino acid oxidase-like deaminating enzyme
MTSPEVVVIGGGIVGTACAYYLAREGVKVHLLERGPLGCGASKAGMCHVVTWEEPEIHLELARGSKKLYQELAAELPFKIDYRDTGSIAIVEKPESMANFAAMIERLNAWGLHCKMIDQKELREREPNVAPDVAGGAFFAEDAQVNPLYATLALARAAQDYGATVETNAEVSAIETTRDGSVAAVVTNKGRISTGSVVCAAGAWSPAIGKMVGLDIPIKPRKGTLVVTVPVPDNLMNCKIILAAGYMDAVKSGAGNGAAVAANVQQTQNGTLLLGSSRQFVDYDREVDPRVVSMMLTRCLRFFPILKEVTAIRTWAGLRPYTPDLLPIIGPVEEVGGFYMASGHEGIGITEGPITGKLISQVVTGQQPQISLDDLTLSRFFKREQPLF